MLRGFDVSHYQGNVDWASLKSRYGITWGAAKATEGTSYKDSQFAANWRKMKAAGLVRMAYHFAHPGGSASAAAQTFLSYVGPVDPTDIMVMDMESNPNNLPMLQVRDWLAAWADVVTKETGRKPFLYTGSGYIQNNSTKDLKPHYAAWWFPRYSASTWPSSITGYPSSNNWGGAPDIWQFSQSFAGSMDANVANMTLADLQTRGRAVKPPVTPPPVKPTPPAVKDMIDMATQAEVAQAVSDGMRDYLHDFYTTGQGTGWQYHQDTMAALNALGDKLDALIAALTPKSS